jgi:hypothetical protein
MTTPPLADRCDQMANDFEQSPEELQQIHIVHMMPEELQKAATLLRLCARRERAIVALVGAVWQVLDDMGADGHSCCGLAKAQLRIAFEPFHDIEQHDEMDVPIAEAQRIINECAR